MALHKKPPMLYSLSFSIGKTKPSSDKNWFPRLSFSSCYPCQTVVFINTPTDPLCSVVVSILVPWPIPHCATAAATKLNCRLLIPSSILLVHDLSMLSRAQPAASNFLPADPDENKTLFFSIAPSLYNLYMLQSFLLSDWIKWKMKLICVWLWQ